MEMLGAAASKLGELQVQAADDFYEELKSLQDLQEKRALIEPSPSRLQQLKVRRSHWVSVAVQPLYCFSMHGSSYT